jgi:RimJ/RimL family protein N-acetyltransferase
VLRGELTGLRAHTDRDIEVLETELVLCRYGFAIRGLHRLQISTLADNHAMIAAAVRVGFRTEGTTRDAAWIDGAFADGVILSLLFPEWSPGRSAPAPQT